MTPAVERDLWAASDAGRNTGADDRAIFEAARAREWLVLAYRRRALRLAARAAREVTVPVAPDVVEQAAVEALCRSVRAFDSEEEKPDPSRPGNLAIWPFATYLAVAVRNAVKGLAAKEKKEWGTRKRWARESDGWGREYVPNTYRTTCDLHTGISERGDECSACYVRRNPNGPAPSASPLRRRIANVPNDTETPGGAEGSEGPG